MATPTPPPSRVRLNSTQGIHSLAGVKLARAHPRGRVWMTWRMETDSVGSSGPVRSVPDGLFLFLLLLTASDPAVLSSPTQPTPTLGFPIPSSTLSNDSSPDRYPREQTHRPDGQGPRCSRKISHDGRRNCWVCGSCHSPERITLGSIVVEGGGSGGGGEVLPITSALPGESGCGLWSLE